MRGGTIEAKPGQRLHYVPRNTPVHLVLKLVLDFLLLFFVLSFLLDVLNGPLLALLLEARGGQDGLNWEKEGGVSLRTVSGFVFSINFLLSSSCIVVLRCLRNTLLDSLDTWGSGFLCNDGSEVSFLTSVSQSSSSLTANSPSSSSSRGSDAYLVHWRAKIR